MDCTEPTSVRMYENGALVVDANVVRGNAIQPEPSSANYSSTTAVMSEDTPSNENANIEEFRTKMGYLPAYDKRTARAFLERGIQSEFEWPLPGETRDDALIRRHHNQAKLHLESCRQFKIHRTNN